MASYLRAAPDGDTIATADLRLRRCQTCGEEYPSDYLVCPRDATSLELERDSADPLIGCVLAGTYRIVRVLGRGGMGRLYDAQHTRLDRRFAVKVLHEAHSRTREVTVRFDREARALSRLRSDHVLDVVDVLRTPDDRAAIVTARLDGEDLKVRLDRVGKLETAQAVSIARQVCRGLAAAHAQGVIHRDLKPSNLFLEAGADGRVTVKILDFGVAKLAGEPELTRTGAVVGTPAYMAPEQARASAKVDERADIYSVGAVLYRMLTGRSPYVGDDPASLLTALLSEPPRRPRAIEASIPVGLEAVVQRAMARDPDERPGDALELERELSAFDPSGPAPDTSAWAPRSNEGATDTLVLPRGSVARAESIAKEASRARPIAIAVVIAGALASAATLAMGVVGVQTLSGGPRAPMQESTAWLLGGAALLGSFAALARLYARRWSSLPDVLRANRTLGSAVLACAASMGVIELCTRAWAALAQEHAPLEGSALLTRSIVAALASLFAYWLGSRKK
jgi:serine/threonine protein kinase